MPLRYASFSINFVNVPLLFLAEKFSGDMPNISDSCLCVLHPKASIDRSIISAMLIFSFNSLIFYLTILLISFITLSNIIKTALEASMKPVQWIKFLKETIPDRHARRQLQRHLNQHLITPTLSDRHAAKQNRGGLS